jgi:parallel beta-helix repeat protein
MIGRKVVCGSVVLCACLAAMATPLSATTYYVNAVCGNDAWSGQSDMCAEADGPKAHLQAAIDAAANGDEIIAAPGTYAETIDLRGKSIDLHSSSGALLTVIEAAELEASAVTCATNEGPDTVLDGFTIHGADIVRGTIANPRGIGAGMFISGGSPTITNCIFMDNEANAGGGIYNENGSPAITHCMFEGNAAWFFGGGAIYNEGGAPLIRDCEFEGNGTETDFGSRGGAAILNEASNATIVDCDFEKGEGEEGEDFEPDGNVANYGGAPHIEHCEFEDNSVAMFNYNSAPELVNCAFEDNEIAINNVAGSAPLLTNCKFADNKRGAVLCDASNATLTNCTFSGNMTGGHSGLGGAVDVIAGSNVSAANCIFWGNTPEEIHGEGSTVSLRFCDILGGYPGEGNLDANPLFINEKAQNLRLSRGSPCVDAGDSAAVPAGITLDRDQRSRFFDDRCIADHGRGAAPQVDLGAYESHALCGDMNCDNLLNSGDIDAFVLALCRPLDYEAMFPACSLRAADANADGAVNNFDIDGFVDLLAGG